MTNEIKISKKGKWKGDTREARVDCSNSSSELD